MINRAFVVIASKHVSFTCSREDSLNRDSKNRDSLRCCLLFNVRVCINFFSIIFRLHNNLLALYLRTAFAHTHTNPRKHTCNQFNFAFRFVYCVPFQSFLLISKPLITGNICFEWIFSVDIFSYFIFVFYLYASIQLESISPRIELGSHKEIHQHEINLSEIHFMIIVSKFACISVEFIV